MEEKSEEILLLYGHMKIELPIPKSDFDNPDMTYEEFLNKILADLDFKKSVFIDFIRDNKDTLIKELIILVETNRMPILVNVEGKDWGIG